MKPLRRQTLLLFSMVAATFWSATAAAQPSSARLDSGDTAWMLVSSALVLLMTPGLALFYGGMVRRKNVLATFMYSYFAMGLVTIQWVVVGYSLVFGQSHGGLIGGADFILLTGIPSDKGSLPHLAFMSFQLKFAIITPALISGAFAERMRFSAYVLFALLWTTLVYDPIAHWAWNEAGWMYRLGVLDFAGGTVVHWTAGLSALICALYIGKRLGYGRERFIPHNLTMTVTGAGLLWFGWFGFNGGSALAAGQTAALAFATTHISAAGAAMSWVLTEWAFRGKPTLLGFVSGLVAGLVAITPGAGFVSPTASLAIGIVAGAVCYGAVLLKERLHYDDSLDAWGVHGVGGLLGALMVGIFSRKLLNPSGADGLLASGSFELLGKQALGILAAGAYTAVLTVGILFAVDKWIGLRVVEDEEREGLDSTQHGETGYV